MQIDRTRFVALVGLLAGAGCPAQPQGMTPPATVAPPVEPQHAPLVVDAAVESAAPSPSASAALPAPRASASTEDWGPLTNVRSEFEKMERSSAPCDRQALDKAEAQRRTMHTEGTPDPVVQEAEPCFQLREPPNPSCEGYILIMSGCAGAVSALAPTVARKAMQCLSRQSGTNALCRRRTLDDCVRSAAHGVQPKIDAASLCEAVVQYCRQTPADGARRTAGAALTSNQCQEVLAGARCWSQWDAVECMTNECSSSRCLLPQRWRVLDEL